MRCRSDTTLTILVICILAFASQQSALTQSEARIRDGRYDGRPIGKINGQGTGASGLERYLTIARNNLFAPLGSGDEVKRQEYALTGILGNVAIIQPVGRATSHYIAEGETFGDGAKLVHIGEDSVTIIHEGRRMELKLGSGASTGSRGSGRETRPSPPNQPINRGR